jgi:penicillin amidase
LGSAYSYGWRSQEIVDRLHDAPPLTMDSAEQIFYDDTIRFAADLVPILLKIKVSDPWVVEGQRTLVGWDYSASKDSAAAAYFNVVCHNIFKLTFRGPLVRRAVDLDQGAQEFLVGRCDHEGQDRDPG